MISDLQGVHDRFFGEKEKPAIQIRPGKRTFHVNTPPPVKETIESDPLKDMVYAVPELSLPEFEQAIQDCIRTGETQYASSKASEVTQVFKMDYEPGINSKARSCQQYSLKELGLEDNGQLSAIDISRAIDKHKQRNTIESIPSVILEEPVLLNQSPTLVYNLDTFIQQMPEYYKHRAIYWNMKYACQPDILNKSKVYAYFKEYLEVDFVCSVIDIEYDRIQFSHLLHQIRDKLWARFTMDGVGSDLWYVYFIRKQLLDSDAMRRDTHNPLTGQKLT